MVLFYRMPWHMGWFMVFDSHYGHRDELKHIWGTLNQTSNYLHWVISKVFKEIWKKQAYRRNISQDNDHEDQKQHLLVLSLN